MDTIKKVANAILDAGEGCQSGLVYVDPVEAAKAAIAVLSTDAELVAYRPSYQQIKDTVQANIKRMHDAGESHLMMALWLSADLDKLYPPQPAPSVAVKALEWKEDGKYLRARMGDREYSVNITADGETWAGATRPYALGTNLTWSSVPNCSMVSLESAKAACQADCQSRYAALSAQVQDVAVPDGWHMASPSYHKDPYQVSEFMGVWHLRVVNPNGSGRTVSKHKSAQEAMLAAAPAAKLEEKP